jgi:putative MATE family efflux protein
LATAPQSPFLTAPIGPTLLRLAAPNVVSMVMSSLTMMTEAYFVGQLGTVPLAGLALAFPMMMLMGMLSAGAFGGTITGAVSRRLGAGDRAGAEELAVHALLLMVLLSCICSAIFLLFGRFIYGALGGSGAVLEQALAYSDTLFVGCIGMWLSNALAGIVRATGNMGVAARIGVLGSLLQISIAGVLVFGVGPFPELGIAGAPAGIIISSTVSTILMLIYLTSRCRELRLHVSGVTLHWAPIIAILRIGGLAALNPFSTLASVLVITASMARFGTDVLAGYGIGARLEFLVVPMIFGLGAASTALVGVHFGARQIARAHRVGWTAAGFSALLAGSIGAVAALFPGLWADLFTDVEAVRAACRAYLQMVAPFYAFFGVATCLYFASQGAGRVLWPVLAALVRVAIIVSGSVMLAGNPDAQPQDFFLVIAAGMVAHALVTASAIRLGAWRTGNVPAPATR